MNDVLSRESWQEWGSCRRLAPEVFYPEDGGRRGLQAREEHAKPDLPRLPGGL
jgi:WhiB family redox-sensing transcriptional regulator